MATIEEQSDQDRQSSSLGLRAQLILFMALFSLGPLVITNYVGYETSRREQRRLSFWSIQNAARLATLETELFTREKRNLVSSLIAGNKDLMRPTARALASPVKVPEGGSSLDHHLEAKAREAAQAVVFYVLSPEGAVLGSSWRTAPRAHWKPSTPCASMAGEETGVRVIHGRSGPLLLVREPFPVPGTTERGVFCGVFDFVVRDKLNVFASMMWSGGRFRLGNESGRVLIRTSAAESREDRGVDPKTIQLYPPGVFPSPEAFRSSATDVADPVERPGHLPESLLEKIRGHRRWAGKYDPPGSEMHYAASVPVRGTDWFVVADVPESSVLASLQGLRNGALFGGAIFSLIVLAGIGYTVRRFVGPISELLEAIREMKHGDLEQSVEQRGPREISELMSHFNAMSTQVAELQGNLEQRVEERTESLRQSRAFNELLIDSIDDNLVVVDEDRRITKANAAALATYGGTIVGERYCGVFEDSEKPSSDSPVESSFESGRAASEERVHRYNGRPEIMEVQVFPLPGGGGGLADEGAARLVMTRRVTEEKRRQAQMMHSEKMAAYGLLAAGIAHEIGNPLNSIKAQLQRARIIDDDESVDETLEVVESEVDRIGKLLRQIVGVARRQETEQRLVSVNQVAEDAVQLLRHDPGSRQVDFELDLDESIPPIRGDEDRLLQVLLNLGINASDAIDGSGHVCIRTDAEPQADAPQGDDQPPVRIRISDTGPGVPEELQERIFEPHFTTKPAGKGTGLGLFVSSRIVENLSGTIRYLDEAAEGATFEIHLPAA